MAIRNLLLLVGGLVMLALTSTKLTLLVLRGVPLVVLPIVLFGRRVRKLARASQDRVGDVGAYVDEALHEIRTVQAYGHEAEDRRRFAERVEAAFATAVAAHTAARAPGRGGDRAGLRRGRRDPVDRRPRRRCRADQRRAALRIRLLRGDRRGRRRHDQRGGRRSAARGRRHRAAVRIARRRAGHPRARAPGRAARRRRAAPWRSTHVTLPLSVAAGRAGARRFLARRAPPAKTSRWSAPRARARRRCSSSCCASTIRRRASCASTASTCAAPIRATCGGASRSCRRIR